MYCACVRVHKMAAREIDWAKFIAEDSEIPPDVTFAVMEQVKNGKQTPKLIRSA